jgi:SAM-dependent methyltransferase
VFSYPEQVINSVTATTKRFQKFRENQQKNLKVVQDVLQAALRYYDIRMEELETFVTVEEEELGNFGNPLGVSDILNHFVRDWSKGGPHKRDLTSEPILSTLSTLFPSHRDPNASPKRVLLPGAGLGRLAHEIASLGGFEVTMNDFSAYMNVVYRYVETLQYPETETFRPYIDWWSYQPSMQELEHEIRYPDVAINASDVLLIEGDFNILFENATASYDAVVTLFFIDTAQNMLDYLDTIKSVLKPGGIWINLGSFLYGASPFLHLSVQDFVDVAERMGFEFLDTDERWGELALEGSKVRTREVSYLFNERAHRKKLYEAMFWVVQKK